MFGIENSLSKFYANYGRFVAKWPLPFIFFPLILSVGLGSGFFLKFRGIGGAENLFTPTDARYKYEEAVLREYWTNGGKYYPGKDTIRKKVAYIALSCRDGGNILSKNPAIAMRDFMRFVVRNVTAHAETETKTTTIKYTDVCAKWRGYCFENNHADYIAAIFARGDEKKINVTYPIFKTFSSTITLNSVLGGIKLNGTTNQLLEAKVWLLVYELRNENAEMVAKSEMWERALEKVLRNQKNWQILNLAFIHSQTFELELAQNAARTTPRFMITGILLIVFSLMCTLTTTKMSTGMCGRFRVVNVVDSKPYLAVAGVLTAGMGVLSALGLMSYLGVPYMDMLAVMPFLCVSIGVDNMYLLQNCWRKTPKTECVADRTAETMKHAAVSITITALTDALSFGVGALTPIFAVYIFCVYTATAIGFTFLYQVTCLIAVMALEGRREEANRHCILLFKVPQNNPKNCLNSFCQLVCAGHFNSITSESTPHDCPAKAKKPRSLSLTLIKKYVNFIVQPSSKIIIVLIYLVYVGFAVWGMVTIPLGFKLHFLLVWNSPATKFYDIRETFFNEQAYQIHIMVPTVPDLSNSTELAKIETMVQTFENSTWSLGRDKVEFWLYAFRDSFKSLGFTVPTGKGFYKHLKHFLLTSDYYSYDVIFDDETTKIRAFRFSVKLKKVIRNRYKMAAAAEFRQIADRFGQYNVTTFSELYPFVDQYEMVLPTLSQNIALALACMFVVAVVLLPKMECALWVILTLVSIEIGVIGFMGHWDVHLDCVSMICILMSLGFSVDFAAHVTYSYITCAEATSADKLQFSLETVALPSLQGAVSTVMGVMVLSTLKAYIISTFFKTVFLIMCLGLFHALMILPAIFTTELLCCKRTGKIIPAPQ